MFLKTTVREMFKK